MNNIVSPNFFSIMKKFIIMSLLALVSVALTGCSSCHSDKAKQETKEVVYHDYDGVAQDFTAGVSHIQGLHRQTMYALNGADYDWRNSKVTLNDEITFETLDDLHIVEVTDVFQLFAPDPVVQFVSSHVQKGTIFPWPIHDLWIEDGSLNNKEIKVTAEDALQRLKEWNGILPKAHSLSLRYPIGPKACNAQWVVGDVFNPLFIDAVTGEVRDWCPAFPN